MKAKQVTISILLTCVCVASFVGWILSLGVVKEQVLLQACGIGSVGMVRYLLNSGVNPDARDGWNGSCMFYAAANGHVEIADVLLSRGIGVDTAYRLNRTALIMAAGAGKHDTVKFLIERGANVHMLDIDGKTALDHAIEQKHLVTAEFLRSSQLTDAVGSSGQKGQ